MSTEQILAFAVIGTMMGFFIWDRFRYDVVACTTLIVAVALGLVPADKAFSGFSNDIVVIVGSALVVSAGVARSGIVDAAIKRFFPKLESVRAQMVLLLLTVAVLSAFIKNIGALAIMMPVAFQFSRRSGSSPSIFLMPMAFAALLGGLMTQIGTSPNIVVSQLRHEITGESFSMFDFTPVGAVLALTGVLFLIFFYRLVPERENQASSLQETLENSSYATEARVTKQSSVGGKKLSDLLTLSGGEVIATGILRGHVRISPFPDVQIRENDILLLEGPSEALDRVVSQASLALSGRPLVHDGEKNSEIGAIEAVIAHDSFLVGMTARELSIFHSYGVNVIAVSRPGK
ncbi:MAG TPA: SLC13 family permease, partial [Rhizobium sp.]|nr:SLC13 family permease [Rhizobium sp.]